MTTPTTVHDLKVWPEFFNALADGTKTFEARKNDRGFAVGDILRLREWSQHALAYTGREIERTVTYKLTGPGFGVESGNCILGLSLVAKPQAAAVGDGEWRAHFCRLAKILGCLPSASPECNEHVLAKAARLMSATPAPSAPAQAPALADDDPIVVLVRAATDAAADHAAMRLTGQSDAEVDAIDRIEEMIAELRQVAEAPAQAVTDEALEAATVAHHAFMLKREREPARFGPWESLTPDLRMRARGAMRAALTAFLAAQPIEASK